jgi:hypothetical protein
MQNYDKPQNTSVSEFSTEQNNVIKIIEYLKEMQCPLGVLKNCGAQTN